MKQYVVTAEQMKRYDANTTGRYHMPSLLLMERAALATVEELLRERGQKPCGFDPRHRHHPQEGPETLDTQAFLLFL